MRNCGTFDKVYRTRNWRLGYYHIGEQCSVLMLGPFRIFIKFKR